MTNIESPIPSSEQSWAVGVNDTIGKSLHSLAQTEHSRLENDLAVERSESRMKLADRDK